MKYLILGNGWLGNRLKEYLGKKSEIYQNEVGNDINWLDKDEVLGKYNVIINTAGKTNIDWCEKNKYQTFRSNVIGAYKIARICQRYKIKYVFFSSACIFESKDLTDIKYEDSQPSPQCFYTETKLMVEKLIQEINPDAIILRPRLPISEVPHPRNTLNKLLNYNIINNEQESVTVVEDMLPVIKDLIDKNEKGIFHLVNANTISPARMATLLGHKFELCDKKDQDKRLAEEGRAKRVTVYVGSKKIPLLPDIRERILTVVGKYKNGGKNTNQ